MALATLSIDLVAKLAQFEADMGKAARATQKASQSMTAAITSVRNGLAGLGVGVSFAGLTALIKASIDSLDALNDLKDATGASIENLSGLEDIAARTGTTMDTVGLALTKFNAVLKDTQPGSDAARIFEGLGLSLEALRTMDAAEALRTTSVAFQTITDEGTRARVVQELFGKSVREVAPFLKDLAEQGALVAKVTTQQAEEAEKFNKQLFNLQKNAQDAGRSIVGSILPVLNDGIERFKLAQSAAGGFLGALQLYAQLDYGKNIQGNLDGIEVKIAALEERAKRITSPEVMKGNDSMIADLRKQAEYLKNLRQMRALEGAGEAGDALTRRLAPKPFVFKPSAITKPATGPDQDVDFQRYLAALQKQIEKTQDLNAVEQLNAEITAKRLTVSPAQEARLKNLAEQIDLINQAKAEEEDYAAVIRMNHDALTAMDAVRSKALEDEIRLKQDRIKSMMDATPSAQLEKQRSDVALLTAELEAGRISEEQYLEAVTARLDLTSDKLRETNNAAKELGLSFTSAFEDAVVGGKSFSQVLKGIEQDLLRIVMRKMVTEPLGNAVTGAISGAMSGGDGGLGSIFSKLMSFDGGGYTGSGPRSGGLDGKGGFLAVMHPRENVEDLVGGRRTSRSSGSGSAGVSISIINQGQPIQVTSQRQSRGADGGMNVELMVRSVEDALADNIAAGSGSLHTAIGSRFATRGAM